MSRQISLRLPERVVADLDRRARRQRRSRSALIREILERHARAEAPDHPYARVRDLVGSLSGGLPDLGARHRAHLARTIRDRRR